MTYASYAKIRDARGLKDNDVAHLAKVPQSTFSAWKKGLLRDAGRHSSAQERTQTTAV